MKRLRSRSTHNSAMNRDKPPQPQLPYHHGSGRPLGSLHSAPTRPQVNDQNYGAQKISRK
jgi:hypothetical protein